MGTTAHVKSWRRATKQRMVEAMGGKCQCCGYSRCIAALDFHHLDPNEKESDRPAAWEKIAIKLRKCVLVCANCHREIHAGERSVPENAAKFDESFAGYRCKKGFAAMNEEQRHELAVKGGTLRHAAIEIFRSLKFTESGASTHNRHR